MADVDYISRAHGRRRLSHGKPRKPQPWPIRVTHWLNAPLLVLMGASGLQILAAYPSLGSRGRPYGWYPFHGHAPPAWLTVGGWLAGARHVHFACAWLLVGNALFYGSYLLVSGEWRRRLFLLRRDTRNALAMIAHYLRLRPAPEQGLYNGLQRLAYTSALGLGALEVLSGLAIYKPLQLRRLAWLLGGYDSARAIHLIGLALLAAFTVTHLILVALHLKTLRDMISGGKENV
jgi:thiosulfate reductase cytochrome b subunit